MFTLPMIIFSPKWSETTVYGCPDITIVIVCYSLKVTTDGSSTLEYNKTTPRYFIYSWGAMVVHHCCYGFQTWCSNVLKDT